MIALRDATDVSSEALANAEGDAMARREYRVSDSFFGTAIDCAEDALFVKRLSLIGVPAIFLLCLLTLVLAQTAA